ncbi:hypothetical protein SSX86_005983 [Deinandra increscens subsp. villosa]|uniref:RRM domain-containing protein n=1 Tax=Deinandra increscens subsp. villosa TaxID=3103831 RepID=A0AAP0DMV5_9ASTR
MTIEHHISKIFISNLPKGCSGADLASHVRVLGQIYDLYIARKRDKRGNRLGFILMLDIKEKEELLRNLKGIRIGENKLWFNYAWFVLEKGEINTARDRPAPKHVGNSKFNDGREHPNGRLRKDDCSFRELFGGKSVSIDKDVHAFSKLHGRAVVVRMLDLEALKSIYLIMHGICPGYGKVQYLGGLDLLISFKDDDLVDRFMENAGVLTDKFHSIARWEGSKFGKVVHKAKKSETDFDLSFEYIGVLTGDGKRITEEVVLNWKSRKFRVWVTEELGEWIPDFYSVPSDANVNDDPISEDSEGREHDSNMPEQSPVVDAVQANKDEVNADPLILERNDLEINDHNGHSKDPQPNVVKRKKFKKCDMGRPSGAYTSSNESQKVVKKTKHVSNDIFGLNSLLGITDDGPENEEDYSISEEDGSIDLNRTGVTEPGVETEIDDTTEQCLG